ESDVGRRVPLVGHLGRLRNRRSVRERPVPARPPARGTPDGAERRRPARAVARRRGVLRRAEADDLPRPGSDREESATAGAGRSRRRDDVRRRERRQRRLGREHARAAREEGQPPVRGAAARLPLPRHGAAAGARRRRRRGPPTRPPGGPADHRLRAASAPADAAGGDGDDDHHHDDDVDPAAGGRPREGKAGEAAPLPRVPGAPPGRARSRGAQDGTRRRDDRAPFLRRGPGTPRPHAEPEALAASDPVHHGHALRGALRPREAPAQAGHAAGALVRDRRAQGRLRRVPALAAGRRRLDDDRGRPEGAIRHRLRHDVRPERAVPAPGPGDGQQGHGRRLEPVDAAGGELKGRRVTVLAAATCAALGATSLLLGASAEARSSAPPSRVLTQLPTVVLDDPGWTLQGVVTVRATAEALDGRTIATVRFEHSRAGAGDWHAIGTSSTPPYSVDFDTGTVADGHYDLRAVAADSGGNTAASAPMEDRLVANVAPAATLVDPGAVLRGSVALDAAATASAGRTIASVEFQRAAAGSSDWTTIGTATSPPYRASLDTTPLPDGLYDLRVVAIDSAGDSSSSPRVRDRLVANVAPGAAIDDPGPLLRENVLLTGTASASTGRK